MQTQIPDRLTALLRALDRIPYAGRIDAIVNEVIETGGIYRVPNPTTAGARYFCELHLHGITAHGGDEADMITNWIDAARAATSQGEAA